MLRLPFAWIGWLPRWLDAWLAHLVWLRYVTFVVRWLDCGCVWLPTVCWLVTVTVCTYILRLPARCVLRYATAFTFTPTAVLPRLRTLPLHSRFGYGLFIYAHTHARLRFYTLPTVYISVWLPSFTPHICYTRYAHVAHNLPHTTFTRCWLPHTHGYHGWPDTRTFPHTLRLRLLVYLLFCLHRLFYLAARTFTHFTLCTHGSHSVYALLRDRFTGCVALPDHTFTPRAAVRARPRWLRLLHCHQPARSTLPLYARPPTTARAFTVPRFTIVALPPPHTARTRMRCNARLLPLPVTVVHVYVYPARCVLVPWFYVTRLPLLHTPTTFRILRRFHCTPLRALRLLCTHYTRLHCYVYTHVYTRLRFTYAHTGFHLHAFCGCIWFAFITVDYTRVHTRYGCTLLTVIYTFTHLHCLCCPFTLRCQTLHLHGCSHVYTFCWFTFTFTHTFTVYLVVVTTTLLLGRLVGYGCCWLFRLFVGYLVTFTHLYLVGWFYVWTHTVYLVPTLPGCWTFVTFGLPVTVTHVHLQFTLVHPVATLYTRLRSRYHGPHTRTVYHTHTLLLVAVSFGLRFGWVTRLLCLFTVYGYTLYGLYIAHVTHTHVYALRLHTPHLHYTHAYYTYITTHTHVHTRVAFTHTHCYVLRCYIYHTHYFVTTFV